MRNALRGERGRGARELGPEIGDARRLLLRLLNLRQLLRQLLCLLLCPLLRLCLLRLLLLLEMLQPPERGLR